MAGTRRLYRAELFEPVVETPWEPDRVRDAIAAIVAGVEHAYLGLDRLWPADPLPAPDGWDTPDPMTSLYQGAAGTLYALHELQRRGHVETALDVPALALEALELFRRQPDFGRTTVPLREPRDAALLMGETGILVLAWRLAPDAARPDLADRLERRVRQNVDNDVDEVMWGTPGTLIAASAMFRATREGRWLDAAASSADALQTRRDRDGLWTQHLYGHEVRRTDPIHGVAGILHAIAGSLEGESREALQRDAAELFARLAVVEDGLANWPVNVGEEPDLLRWCAGAPGVVVATSAYLDVDLLLAAGELTWRAGAPRMATGPGICCGTSGNGYALLKVFERTGDELWLHRARHFALHALMQVKRDRDRFGPRWHSLWKGDPGVALFAADCLDERPVYPVLDAM